MNKNETNIAFMATDIVWDTDGEDIDSLPVEVPIPFGVDEEDIADYLSDKYGFLVESFAALSPLAARMRKAFIEGHPAPWAVFEADTELLEREDELFFETVDDIILDEMLSDESPETEKLIGMYAHSSDGYRMMVDATLVHLCGWSLPTLLNKAAEELATREVLHAITEELMAEGAWCAHTYAFQNFKAMPEYAAFIQLLEDIDKEDAVTAAYDLVESEFTRVSEEGSFMDEESEMRIRELDIAFTEALREACKAVSDSLLVHKAEEKRPHTVQILLRETGDPNHVYGILTAETDGTAADVVARFLSAKADVAKEADWQINDILALLPEEWNARVEDPTSICI